jgi:hypothetical protein
MAYKSFFGKTDECICGKWLSTTQRVCPYCKEPNPDYRPKHQIGSAMKAVRDDEEENKEEDFNKLG